MLVSSGWNESARDEIQGARDALSGALYELSRPVGDLGAAARHLVDAGAYITAAYLEVCIGKKREVDGDA